MSPSRGSADKAGFPSVSLSLSSRSESADVFFEQLFSVANAYKPNRVALSSLKEWKQRFLSLEAGKKQCIRTPAKKFTFDEAVRDFGLTYSIGMNDVQTWWMIETLPEVKNFQPSASISKVSPGSIDEGPC